MESSRATAQPTSRDHPSTNFLRKPGQARGSGIGIKHDKRPLGEQRGGTTAGALWTEYEAFADPSRPSAFCASREPEQRSCRNQQLEGGYGRADADTAKGGEPESGRHQEGRDAGAEQGFMEKSGPDEASLARGGGGRGTRQAGHSSPCQAPAQQVQKPWPAHPQVINTFC